MRSFITPKTVAPKVNSARKHQQRAQGKQMSDARAENWLFNNQDHKEFSSGKFSSKRSGIKHGEVMKKLERYTDKWGYEAKHK